MISEIFFLFDRRKVYKTGKAVLARQGYNDRIFFKIMCAEELTQSKGNKLMFSSFYPLPDNILPCSITSKSITSKTPEAFESLIAFNESLPRSIAQTELISVAILFPFIQPCKKFNTTVNYTIL